MTFPTDLCTIATLPMENQKTSYKFRTSQKIYLPFKRFCDIFVSLLAIILLSWLLIIAAIITKCSSKGPVIFKQKRLGKNEKPFTIYKFRSMRIDAPIVAAAEIDDSERKDMTTKWGRIMRKTSIDELPQLFNILFGQMSFVGPRPDMIENNEEIHQARLATSPSAYMVRPGLSGMAQIYMHRDHDPVKKAEWDSKYVRQVSAWTDIKLFALSFFVLFGYDAGR